MSRLDYLLSCAMTYKDAAPTEAAQPETFADVEAAIRSHMDALLFEARECMAEPIEAPEAAYLHPVDVDTPEPGIVSSKTGVDVLRRRLPLPKVTYASRVLGRAAPPVDSAPTPRHTVPDAKDAITQGCQRDTVTLEETQVHALKELKAEEQRDKRRAVREEQKRAREAESPEEREARLAEAREKRRRKQEEKLEREELDSMQVPEVVEASAELADGAGSETAPEGAEQAEATSEETGAEATGEDGAQVIVDIEEVLEADAAAESDSHQLLPARQKGRPGRLRFFQSPVPFDRHLEALTFARPSLDLAPALLHGAPNPNVVMIQGPPGTGKTHTIVEMLKECEGRAIVCVSTNVGAANVYARCVQAELECSLVLAPSKMPPGAPLGSNSPCAKIVCCTVSGRNGPLLLHQQFDEVYLDEAGQCTEAHAWGLWRPEVRRIVMVGDVQQLPATVSEKSRNLGYDRSLMQRLTALRYPVRLLGTQRRMHPDIVSLPNRLMYDSRLHTEYNPPDRSSSDQTPAPYGVVDCDGEDKPVGTSYVNEREAKLAIELATQLATTFADVVIIAPYQAQCRYLLAQKSNFVVHTVDSFQGREADAVVLSVVRTQCAGFWSDSRRLNVALTRAKHCLRVVGAAGKWSGPLQEVYLDAVQRKCLQ